MDQKTALIVDDEPDIRELLEITLGRMDISTLSAANVASAKLLLAENDFDFCLTDMNLPDGNGIELVQHIQRERPHLPVAMITAHGSMESAVEALKAGAFDFVSKPVNLELLRHLVDTALNLPPLNTTGEAKGAAPPTLLGETQTMKTLRSQILKLARSQAPIYISGESGSGKELVAKLIHEEGPHHDAPFIPVNCGAIPGELMESEFFGHTKGSFTGAVSDKEGLFHAANGGTLFLDEVADLPLPMQVKLLRGIQEKAIRPIGGQKEISVDVRILSATHKDLAAEVEAGRFRQDLFYRINVIELKVPALRERHDDIPALAADLLTRMADEYQTTQPELSEEALASLHAYHFPGNVRELQNILERAMTLCENDVIRIEDLALTGSSEFVPVESPVDEPLSEPIDSDADQDTDGQEVTVSQDVLPEDGESLDSYLEDIEKNVIVKALEATRWNKTAAAKKLGITFRALRYKLKKLDLE
ncbi:MAG: sigma-54-dependent Fis family transcriptional regulator [Gammaproteobacteria bacterium]|jgi:two-component system response regulator PilR (NtrC family)|nr:sigma-54-dependent Fis family transcriptional regulator [Gammaproteobacteria bacterium]|tara:strand:- start:189 stop:1619 length:1431 start_codon:yes stop_codon:yes gene_type:complete